MSGETADGLKKLGPLKIRTRAGLFSDFVQYTDNRIAIHVRSSAVDWRLDYAVPASGTEVSLDDLFSRIPDLHRDYANISNAERYADLNEVAYSEKEGFQARVRRKGFRHFQATYEGIGYAVKNEGDWDTLTCDPVGFAKELPMFIHSYVHKTFGSIPALFLTEPFSGGTRYSQLGITYMVAFVLGMLVRYYPTHWISLIQGDNGDAMWPTINRAQQFVELSYPELVSEMILDNIEQAEKNRAAQLRNPND